MDDRIHKNASCLSQSQEKYSRFPARTSGIFISCLLWFVIIFEPLTEPLTLSFTQLEAAYPSVTAAVRYCHEPLLDGNVCSTTQYGQSKSWLSLTACLSILDQQDSRHCYYKAHCRIRALGSRTLQWNSLPQTVRTESNR